MLLILAACKKYPEGGTSVRAGRIFNSTDKTCWDVHQFLSDGVDSTDFIVSTGDPATLKSYVCFFKYSRSNYCIEKYGGSFEIDYDGEHVQIGGMNKGSYSKYGSATVVRNVLCPGIHEMRWKICRCKKDEMILEGKDMGHNFRLVLRR